MSIPFVEKAIDKIPSYVLVYSLVSGLMLVFVSPIRFYLPPLIIDPFSQEIPNILGSFLAIAIVSLCLGFPLYLAHPLLLGDEGLNSRIMKFARLKEDEGQGNIEPSLEDNLRLIKWLRQERYSFYTDFLMIQYGLLCALIIGSEVALALNASYILFLRTPLTHLLPLFITTLRVIPYFYTTYFMFIASVLYNRRQFRGYFNKTWKALRSIYEDEISRARFYTR